MTVQVSLLGGFALEIDGAAQSFPLSVQRVVAFLALHAHPLPRLHVAASLWLDSPEKRSSANLRSCLWRLRRCKHPVVVASGDFLALAPDVLVDVRVQRAAAADLLGEPSDASYQHIQPFLTGDLLPDWSEEWVVSEREGLRQLRLHVLEEQCVELARKGHFSLAVQAGIAAVTADPLRESAHRALIAVYLAEGNHADAIRQYQQYRWTLQSELGLSPSILMEQTIGALRARNDVVSISG